MIRTTLKEYLSVPNPPLYLNKKTHHVTYTTEHIVREPLEGKAEWLDFEVESIQSLFSTVLSQPFDLPAHPTLPPAQLRVRDERCFESVLLSHNCAIVNAALMAATKFMNIPSVTWLVGSYAEQVIDREKSFPDWAGISELDPRLNILPGDSKYAREFFDIGEDGKKTKQTDSDDEESNEVFEDDQESSDVLEGDDSMSKDNSSDICSPHRSAWTRFSDACLEQVNHYARDCGSRYCYLVSPVEIIVARRRMDESLPASISLAATRTPRKVRVKESQPLTPTRRLWGEPLPSSPPIMSSPYSDNGNPDTNMRPIQLRSIYWDASGPNELTFNLAIWALHIIAALDREVRTDYPSIADDPKYKNWKTGKIGQKPLTMAILISYRWLCGSEGCFKLDKEGVVLVVGEELLLKIGRGRCFCYERSLEIYNVMTRGCQ